MSLRFLLALKGHGPVLHIESQACPKEAQSWRTLDIIYREEEGKQNEE